MNNHEEEEDIVNGWKNYFAKSIDSNDHQWKCKEAMEDDEGAS